MISLPAASDEVDQEVSRVIEVKTYVSQDLRFFQRHEAFLMDQGQEFTFQVLPTKATLQIEAHVGLSITRTHLPLLNLHPPAFFEGKVSLLHPKGNDLPLNFFKDCAKYGEIWTSPHFLPIKSLESAGYLFADGTFRIRFTLIRDLHQDLTSQIGRFKRFEKIQDKLCKNQSTEIKKLQMKERKL